MPEKAKELVKEFINNNRETLMEMWGKGIYKKIPPID